MDTIDLALLTDVVDEVLAVASENRLRYVHTVTVELNGATGGADVIVKGFTGNDVSLCNERTFKVALP